MTSTRTVTIPHLGRVEGHGGIFVKVVGDEVLDVNMDIHEGSRYYEALLKGKHFTDVQGIITRVCAICSANHTVTALSAIENALGVEVSERTLAREAIHNIIPGGGFLADDHTLDNWRWAQWKPKLIDRSRYDNWVEAGSKSLHDRANDRARKILAEHTPAPLPEAAEQTIKDVLKRREAGN